MRTSSPPSELRHELTERARGLLPHVLATGSVLVVLALLVMVGTQSLLFGLVTIGVAVFLLALSILGAERLGTVVLICAYATAPMYKGLATSTGSPITAPDLLFVLGFGLLALRLLRGRPRAHITYGVGLIIALLFGMIAAIASGSAQETLISVTLWMMTIFVLPIALAMWNPRHRIVLLLAGAYVAGHVFDTAWAILHDGAHRWTGLSTHPNYFGQAALLSCALMIFLLGKVPVRYRWLAMGATAICGAGVVFSGSRAATVVLAVLLLCIPFLERTTRATVVVIGILTLGVVAAALQPLRSGEGSALSRLTGAGTSVGSDLARTEGLEKGVRLFFDHPFVGNGMSSDVLFDIHNGPLEVAVSIGIFGLFGYLLLLWSFVRILFTDLPLRRLGYVALAYVGFGAAVPGLYDRSIWAVVALGILAVQRPHPEDVPEDAPTDPADRPRTPALAH
jgi:hypothetical protein